MIINHEIINIVRLQQNIIDLEETKSSLMDKIMSGIS